MGATNFQELVVWQKAHQFVLDANRMSRQFPKEELFGLTSQLRRAAVSIPANIAEGFVKRGTADKLRFYNIAQGSLEECRYYLLLAHGLGYAATETLNERLDEVSRMLEAYAGTVARSRVRVGRAFFWLLAPGSWLLAPLRVNHA